MAFSNSRAGRLYLEVPATFGAFNNTSGASSIAGSNCAKHVKCVLTPATGLIRPQSKTGTRTMPAGVAGKRGGAFSLTFEFIPNGSGGVVPDIDPVLQAIFGQASTIVASTSVTYALSDNVQSFNLYYFRTPSTVKQMAALGCVVEKFEMNLGQDVADLTVSGSCISIIDSVTFSSQDSVAKGSLTAFPVEPSSPTTNGAIVPGFIGSATYASNVMTNISTAKISGTIGNKLEYAFGTYEPNIPGGAVRNIAISTDLFDDDTTNSSTLYTDAFTKSAVTIALVLGSVAGARIAPTLIGTQFVSPVMEEGELRWMAKYGDSPASGTSVTALNEFGLVIN